MENDGAAVDHVLSTTRSVRKRLDFSRPVEPEVIERCIAIALQAPTGSNAQGWRFLVLTDADKRKGIADLYLRAFTHYRAQGVTDQRLAAMDAPAAAQYRRVVDSSTYLAEHMHEAPVMVIPCIEGRVERAGAVVQAGFYGSILPAAWSFMLALRARGLGTAWTTLHLVYEKEAAALLGIPDTVTQAALFPVAYTHGTDFKPAARIPAERLTFWNAWGQGRAAAAEDRR